MKVFYKLSLLCVLSLVGWQGAFAQTPAHPVDCILDAGASSSADITAFIENGITDANHGWMAGDGNTVIPTTATATPLIPIATGPSGPTGVDGGACGSTTTDPADVWYSFTPTVSFDAWVDLYRGANNGQDMVIELYETVTPLGGDCAGSITGEINYLGCSDQGTGDGLERATCTGLSGERIDVSGLTVGTTYYLRIAQWNGNAPTADADFILAVERSTVIGPAQDRCDHLADADGSSDLVIEQTAGCADNPLEGRDVNITYANQSNAGAFGNSVTGTEGGITSTPCLVGDFINNSQIPTPGTAIAFLDRGCDGDNSNDGGTRTVINNVINNNVMYAIRVSSCSNTGQPGAEICIDFDNLEIAPADGAVQLTLIGPLSGVSDYAECTGVGPGTPPVAVFSGSHTLDDGTCFSLKNLSNIINGTFIIMVEGSNGALVKYDMNVKINYLGACSDAEPDCGSSISNGTVNGSSVAVELAAFVGRAEDKGNRLEWLTYSEQDNRHFEVERSTNGKDFDRLDYVDGSGTTTEAKRYIYFDNSAPAEAYYRLKQVDFNGEYTYSEVVHISRKNDVVSINSVTPNPTVNEANLSFNTNAAGTATISVTDMFGKQISTKEVATIAGENKETLDLATQAAGVYFVTINYGEYQVVKKIMKN